jgi:hypothetical protein
VLAVVVLAGSLSMIVFSKPAQAISCVYVLSGNVHDGRVYNPPETTFKVRGAEASIETRNPDVCNTQPYSFSGGWAMLASDDGNGWAQVGWEKHYLQSGCGTCTRYLWEYTLDYHGTVYTGMYGSPTTGSFHTYTVRRFTSDGLIRLKVDGAAVDCNDQGVCGTTFFDPEDWWTSGCSYSVCMNGQWFGETNWVDDDLPGSSGSKMDVSDVMVKDGQTPGNWFQKAVNGTSWTQVKDCYWAKQDVYTDASGFHVWTDPVDHESSDPGGC